MKELIQFAPGIAGVIAFVVFWVRLERRLTRLETLQEVDQEKPKAKRK